MTNINNEKKVFLFSIAGKKSACQQRKKEIIYTDVLSQVLLKASGNLILFTACKKRTPKTKFKFSYLYKKLVQAYHQKYQRVTLL